MPTPPKQPFVKDIIAHLAALDHGQIASVLGDAKLVELVTTVMKSRTDLEAKTRGSLILDIVGGPESIFEDAARRRSFFLSFSGEQRQQLAVSLGVASIDRFNLTAERRAKLYACFGLTPPPKVAIAIPPAVTLINVEYGLFPHQTRALLECWDYLRGEIPKVMLHMPTGSGKTRTAMHLICRHLNSREAGLVVWLVSGKELCDQAAGEFTKAWNTLGERGIPLISAWEGRRHADLASFEKNQDNRPQLSPADFERSIWPEELIDGVIVASLDTMWEMIQKWEPAEIAHRASKVTLLVFDEAHRSVATTYKRIIEAIHGESHCGLLGLSATPGRAHFGGTLTETESLVELFGQQKVQLNIPGYASPVAALIDQGYLARLTKERIVIADSGIPKKELEALRKHLENSLELPEETLRFIGLNATRNLQIIERAERLVKNEGHKRVIVFAPSVESSHLIASILKSRGIEAASVSSKTEVAARTHAIDLFKATASTPYVLCNYGVLTTGFDAPQTSAVIIARPTLSIVLLNQMAGRAIRGEKVGGNRNALLVTVLDTSIPELVNTINQFHAFDTAWENNDTYA